MKEPLWTLLTCISMLIAGSLCYPISSARTSGLICVIPNDGGGVINTGRRVLPLSLQRWHRSGGCFGGSVLIRFLNGQGTEERESKCVCVCVFSSMPSCGFLFSPLVCLYLSLFPRIILSMPPLVSVESVSLLSLFPSPIFTVLSPSSPPLCQLWRFFEFIPKYLITKSNHFFQGHLDKNTFYSFI